MSSALPSYEQAARVVIAYASELCLSQRAAEVVKLKNASGRVLARPVCSDQDQPPFGRSTRDGFACLAAQASSHDLLPIAGSSRAGEAPGGPLPPGSAWEIMTGAPVPLGADAVVMLEYVENTGSHIRVLPPRLTRAGENIVAQGAHAKAGEEMLPIGTVLGAAQIALAATCGYDSVEVFTRPLVAILTTGDELVPIDNQPGPGQIRNSNALMLAAMVANSGGEPWILPTALDTDQSLDAALRQAATADLLLVSGGVSAGKFDLVESALVRLHARLHFTGVRIQPGKPLVFGDLTPTSNEGELHANGRRLPFFGLPGNPISSAVTFSLFAAPVLAALSGKSDSHPRFALARLKEDSDRNGKPGLTRFLPAQCDFNSSAKEHPQVATVPWHGSGDVAAFARSNCFLVVPEDVDFLEAGTIVRILLP